MRPSLWAGVKVMPHAKGTMVALSPHSAATAACSSKHGMTVSPRNFTSVGTVTCKQICVQQQQAAAGMSTRRAIQSYWYLICSRFNTGSALPTVMSCAWLSAHGNRSGARTSVCKTIFWRASACRPAYQAWTPKHVLIWFGCCDTPCLSNVTTCRYNIGFAAAAVLQ